MTSWTGSVGWGFGVFEKKQWVEFLPPNERVEIQTFKLKKVNKSLVPEPISCFQIPIYVNEHYVYFTYPYHGYVTEEGKPLLEVY